MTKINFNKYFSRNSPPVPLPPSSRSPYTQTNRHASTEKCTYTRTHTSTHIGTHIGTHIHIHTQRHTYTHTYTRNIKTRTHTHVDMYKQNQTRFPPSPSFPSLEQNIVVCEYSMSTIQIQLRQQMYLQVARRSSKRIEYAGRSKIVLERQEVFSTSIQTFVCMLLIEFNIRYSYHILPRNSL